MLENCPRPRLLIFQIFHNVDITAEVSRWYQRKFQHLAALVQERPRNRKLEFEKRFQVSKSSVPLSPSQYICKISNQTKGRNKGMKGASGFSNMDHTWLSYRFVLSHKVLLEQKNTFCWSKEASEAIFPTNWGVYWIWKCFWIFVAGGRSASESEEKATLKSESVISLILKMAHTKI